MLSPFVALVFARAIYMYWGVIYARLFSLTLAITLGCLSIYAGVAFGYIRARASFIFLIVPLVSWIAIGLGLTAAALLSRKVAGTR